MEVPNYSLASWCVGCRGYLVMPLEVRGDDETHAQDGARDWLDAGVQLEGGDLVGTLLDFQPDVDVLQHVT